MATRSITRNEAQRKAARIRVRKITHEDLSISLRQGLDDFLTFRGDIVFAGLVYTVVGLAAVVMTTSMPLMPFFLPVVAGGGVVRANGAGGLFTVPAPARSRGAHRPLFHILHG